MSQATWHAVRVSMPHPAGGTHQWVDGIAGRSRAEALENARANWVTATPATPAVRIDYLGPCTEDAQ